jgi:DNA repair protein RecO (recombination protein O)
MLACYFLIKGFVKNAYSKKSPTELLPGNLGSVTWKGRLDSQLGTLSFEGILSVSARIHHDHIRMIILHSSLSLVQMCLNENEHHYNIYEHLKLVCNVLSEEADILIVLKEYCLFELLLLKESGFGLDLERCVVTNQLTNLCYVSPKSGCAVSYEAALPYQDKLLELPQFMTANNVSICMNQVISALKLTSFFFHKQIFLMIDKPEPTPRRMLVNKIMRNTIS